jgi:hypothetical protein
MTAMEDPKMKISKFTLSEPDSDGEMQPDIEFQVDNPTKSDVHLVQYTVALLDEKGALVVSDSDSEAKCTVDRGGIETISVLGPAGISSHVVGSDRDNVKVRVNATLCAREFHRLGEISIPAKDHETARLTKSVKSKLIEGKLVAAVFRPPVDEEGDVSVWVRLAVQSRHETELPNAELKCTLLDRNGSEVDTSTIYRRVRARGLSAFDSYMVVKKSKLKGATMSLDLLLYHPVHVAYCEAMSAPQED